MTQILVKPTEWKVIVLLSVSFLWFPLFGNLRWTPKPNIVFKRMKKPEAKMLLEFYVKKKIPSLHFRLVLT